LTIDTPEAARGRPHTGRQLIGLRLLPAVRDWLDDHHVPRIAWWWEDEYEGIFHPGTTDVAVLADAIAQQET
jgi:hypothetical protein